MAELYAVKGESLSSIADAIREKTGSAEKLELSEMPTAIRGIQAGGGSYDQGLAAGKQAEYDAFWDIAQMNGTRTNYMHAFAGNTWTAETFKPKYDMQPTTLNTCFYSFGTAYGSGMQYRVDLVDLLEAQGVTLDTSKCTNFASAFMSSMISRVGVFDVRQATTLSGTFHAAYLVTIEKLIVAEKNIFSTNTFQNASRLENITIEGTIGSNIDVHWSTLLTHDSLMSIINALKDYSGSGETYSATLGAENLAKLTDAEKMIAVNKGWTLVGWTPPEGAYGYCGCGAPLNEDGSCTEMNSPKCEGWTEE